MYPINDFNDPGYFTLEDADRFHSIHHGGEVALPDGTTLILVIFVISRGATGRFDIFIINKFFLPDGTVKKSMMSKHNIAAAAIDQEVISTATSFAVGLKLKGEIDIEWDELNLRQVAAKDEQIAAISRWGKLSSVRLKQA